MLPSPLHPAVVHFPIVLMVFLPLVAAGALWAIRRAASPRRIWAAPVVLAAPLAVSAWVAVQTGESQERQIESRVAEPAMEAHEEAGERFLILSGIVLAISALGLVGGTVGRAARATTTAAAFGLLVAGYAVGHSGGQLVYGQGGLAAVAGSPATRGGQSQVNSPGVPELGEDD